MTAPGAASTGLLTTSEVAAIFGVGVFTVREWTRTGRLPCFRTPGGHRRFRTADIAALRNGTRRPPGGAA